MAKISVLEKLASDEVGKPGGSSLIFVTVDGDVRAVFTQRSDMDAAMDFAEGLEGREIVVEDETGTVWSSEDEEDENEEEEEGEED